MQDQFGQSYCTNATLLSVELDRWVDRTTKKTDRKTETGQRERKKERQKERKQERKKERRNERMERRTAFRIMVYTLYLYDKLRNKIVGTQNNGLYSVLVR